MDAKILQEAQKIIQAGTEEFLLEIKKSRKEDWKKLKRVSLDFSIFSPLNDEYSEMKYFERVLVEKIREYLVFNVFEGLFKLHRINTTLYETRKCVWHSNTSLEKSVPLMFITDVDGTRKGYRFANHVDDKDELQELFHYYQIYKIEIIEFDTNLPYDRNDYISESLKQYERYISLESFFDEYFSPEEYNSYINLTKKAVEQANEIIGLRTIRTMSGQNLSNFKEIMLPEYSSIPDKIWNYDFSKSSKIWGNINKNDYAVLNESFVTNKLYQAFCGKEDFAKCFVTSEYLFHTVGKKELFDYTSVICGYTKSVEQFIYKLIQINLSTLTPGSTLWIKTSKPIYKIPHELQSQTKTNEKTKVLQIQFKKETQSFFDTTLKSMIYFLKDNEDGWKFSSNNTQAKEYIISCLLDYADSCRNGHFHKDNIYDFKTVERIRKNTILVFYYLLGGYKLTNDHEKDRLELGIESYSFDRLYKAFQEKPINQFILLLADQEIKVVRLSSQELNALQLTGKDLPQHDENGSLNQSAIYFRSVDDFDETNFESACNSAEQEGLIIIDKNNMPQKVWWYDKSKDVRHPVEWENE